MTVNEKISVIRKQLVQHELNAYIIPSTDPHMGEYVPDHWAERNWISEFTGTAGTVIITKDFAGLWTDSRYFQQAEDQLSGSEMELVKLSIPHTAEHIDWLKEKLPKASRVAVNGNMVSVAAVRDMKSRLSEKNIELVTLIDLIKKVWINRPALPDNLVMDHPVAFSGRSRTNKLTDVRELLKKTGATHYLVCTLDEIAWVMNLRGTDVTFNPLFVSFVLLSQDTAVLYMDDRKLTEPLKQNIEEDGIKIRAYSEIIKDLGSLSESAILSIDPGKTNQALMNALQSHVIIHEELSFITRLKAIKNEVEIAGLRNVMVKDGIAWVKFLCWLNNNIGKITITELSAAEKLVSFRLEQKDYMGPSFHPISSYDYHGSIVHYAVSEESSIELQPEGIYLCDTGGHYLDGTTDTTRTITLGNPTKQQKQDFTLALKGTLGVSMLRFPKGTMGYQMDILARKALWDFGLNFGHGTGHGVGFFLNVHEGPQTIGSGASGNMNTSFKPGMITTVEPAIYRDGSYGMRTENMTLCKEDIVNEYGVFYQFETLTLAPIDLELIEVSLLNSDEIKWLNDYHQRVRTKLSDSLSSEEKVWLNNKTRKI
ncbi:MAG: aminopeptidase P family protein [Bacteroidales bacterium]|nr:aminopeptidase P family protein [Bacteroidales bacterium]